MADNSGSPTAAVDKADFTEVLPRSHGLLEVRVLLVVLNPDPALSRGQHVQVLVDTVILLHDVTVWFLKLGLASGDELLHHCFQVVVDANLLRHGRPLSLYDLLESLVLQEYLREDQDVHRLLQTGTQHPQELPQLILLVLRALSRDQEVSDVLLQV